MLKNIAQRPVKPINAYGLFFRENYQQIKRQIKESSFGHISRNVSKLWELCPTRNIYKKRANDAQRHYHHDLVQYNKRLRLMQSSGVELCGIHFILIIMKLINDILKRGALSLTC